MKTCVTNFDRVGEFMKTFGQKVEETPTLSDIDTQRLRIELIREELDELVEAISKDDIVEVADALTDILYVTYGAGHSFGINLDACFHEVQRSNMSKLGEDGKPIYRDDGKILKGPGYSEPDLKSVLQIKENEV